MENNTVLIMAVLIMLFNATPEKIFSADYAHEINTGNINYQIKGDAIYQEGTFVGNKYNHAALYNGSGNVIQVGGLSNVVSDGQALDQFIEETRYYGAHSVKGISPEQRDLIIEMAEACIGNSDIDYTFTNMLDPDSCRPWDDTWDIQELIDNQNFTQIAADIDNIRCDGLVEVCYEIAARLPVWGRNGENQFINEHLKDHNYIPELDVPNPATEVVPVVQRGAYNTESVKFSKMEASDTSKPSIQQANYSTAPQTNIEIIFSEDMNENSFSEDTLSVSGSTSGVHTFTKTFDHTTYKLTINPNENFSYSELVTVIIKKEVYDLFANNLANDYSTYIRIQDAQTGPRTSIILSNLTLTPPTVEPNGTFQVSGNATYNNGEIVTSATATIIIQDGNTYTAAVTNGAFSRYCQAPGNSSTSQILKTVTVSVRDGMVTDAAGSRTLTLLGLGQVYNYGFEYALVCESVQSVSPYDPINIKPAYSMDDDGFRIAVKLVNLYKPVRVRWKLYKPNGDLYDTFYSDWTDDPQDYGYDYWSWWKFDYGWDLRNPSGGYWLHAGEEGKWSCDVAVMPEGGSYERVATVDFTIRYDLQEHIMCKNITTDQQPEHLTNIFSPDDEKAVTFARFEDVSDPLEIKWTFYSPEGLYTEFTDVTDDPQDQGYDWWSWLNWGGWIHINGHNAEYQCGDWQVDVSIKDAWGNYERKYTDYFRIEEHTAPNVLTSISPAFPVESQEIILTVSGTDNNHLKRIALHWNDGSDHTRSWDNINSGSCNYSHSIVSSPSGQYIAYWAEAWDESGNRAESIHKAIVVSQETITPPTTPSGNESLRVLEAGTYYTGGSFSNLNHPVEYLFEWGDGSLSSWGGATQNHSWSNTGTFYIKAKARCAVHTNRESEWSNSYTVIVESAPITKADFTATPQNGASPLNVCFNDMSSGTVTSWLWSFGDGSSSTLKNPCHTYTVPGTYTVSLSVTNASGADTNTKTGYITVTEQLFTADFVATPRSGASPHAVTFTNKSTGPITTWLWDFGDGTTSTSQNTAHTYNNPGTYTVSLTVSGPEGSDTETKTGYIIVLPLATPCECDQNHDGRCDMRDWLLFGQDWGRTNCHNLGTICECDLNDDGRCDMRDWLIFGRNWGKSDCPILQINFALVDRIETGFGRLRGIDVSPDDRTLLAATWADTDQDPILEYSLPDYNLLQTYPFERCHGDVVYSYDGQRAFTTSYYTGRVSAIDLVTGNRSYLDTFYNSWPAGLALSPDGTKIVALVGVDGRSNDENNDGLTIYNVANGAFEELGFVGLNDEPSNIKTAFSPNSQYVYVGSRVRKSSTARIYEVSLTAPYGVHRYKEFSGPAIQSLQDPALLDNRLYVCDMDANRIRVLDLTTWGELSSIPLASMPRALTTCPNSRFLYVLLPDEHAVVAIEPNTGRELGRYDNLDDNPQDIEFNSDGTSLYISHSNTEGSIIELEVNALLTTH